MTPMDKAANLLMDHVLTIRGCAFWEAHIGTGRRTKDGIYAVEAELRTRGSMFDSIIDATVMAEQTINRSPREGGEG